MTTLNFVSIVDIPLDHLINILTDYEKFPNYLPRQLKTMKIIESHNGVTTTEDTIVFSSLVKNIIHQQSIHHQISPNEISSKIISGPAKETMINLSLKEDGTKTKISINIYLKLSLKAKFLEPIIKLWYKRVITGILFTISNEFIQQQSDQI